MDHGPAMKTPAIIGLTLAHTWIPGFNRAAELLRAAYPLATDAEMLERIFVAGICTTIDEIERANKHLMKIRIKKCSDDGLWYADLVGQTVPYLGRWPEAYKSRQPEGFINRVEFCDGEIEIS